MTSLIDKVIPINKEDRELSERFADLITTASDLLVVGVTEDGRVKHMYQTTNPAQLIGATELVKRRLMDECSGGE